MTTSATTTNHSPPPTSIKSSFICGISLPSNELLHDAAQSLYLARKDGYDYVVTSLPDVVTPALSSSTSNDGVAAREEVKQQQQQLLQVRADITQLESKWWCTSIVGIIVDPPSWRSSSAAQLPHGLGLLEALTMTTNTTSGKKRKEEAPNIFTGMLNWASHMNIPAVILPSIPLLENKEAIIDNEEVVDMFADGEDKEEGNNTNHNHNNNTNHNHNHNNNNNDNKSACEYARFIATISTSSICTTSNVKLWIRVPFTLADMAAYQLLLTRCDYNSSVDCLLHIHRKLDTVRSDSVSGSGSGTDGSDDITQLITTLHTFLGSGHVKAVSWDTCIFIRNRKGYPTLSKAHQYIFAMIYGRLGRTIRTLVEGTDDNSSCSGGGGGGGGGATSRKHHLEYLQHLRSQPTLLAKLDTEEAIIETPYLDNLQSPLQPLGDHLEYSTYETFERDPIKYVRYGEAIALALEDGMKDGRYVYVGSITRRSVDDDKGDGIVVDVDIYQVTILVVGAGRGPLVREAIDAVARVSKTFYDDHVGCSQRRRRAIYANIIAIEKNPNAIHYLRGLKNVEPTWNRGQDCSDASSSTLCGNTEETMNDEVMQNNGGSIIPGTSNVTVIGCDMREASSNVQLRSMIQNEAHKADIVVSELLGSFGDNELSPECLDGVQQSGILKTTCVSIPQNYTSYIAPVSSARLHIEASTQSWLPLHPSHGPTSSPVGIQRAMETPYVVRSHAASQTHKEQPCWIFSHPHPSTAKTLSEEVIPATSLSYTLLGSEEDATCISSSANAAHNINNDRHAHMSFPHDPIHGITHGCGYGAIVEGLPSFLSSTPSTAISSSNMQSDSTIVIHGFLGSFHSVLYEAKDKNQLSIIGIAPNSFSVGMFSWFPLYFPLKQPLWVPPGATVNCSIWRRSDVSRVWYEWCADVVDTTHSSNGTLLAASSIHNPGGRSSYVKK